MFDIGIIIFVVLLNLSGMAYEDRITVSVFWKWSWHDTQIPTDGLCKKNKRKKNWVTRVLAGLLNLIFVVYLE